MGALRIGGITIRVPDEINVGGGDINVPIGGSGGGNDHIAAQNLAGQELGAELREYDSLKAQNKNTDAAVQAVVAKINATMQRFKDVVDRVNTVKARKGYSEVRALADSLILGFVTTSGNAVNPGDGTLIPGGGGGGGILAGMDTTTMVVIGIAALLMLNRK